MRVWGRLGILVAVWGVLVLAPMCLACEEPEAPQYSPEVQKRLDALKAKGEPVSVDDLTPVLIPAEENAATIYLKAFAAFVEPDEEARRAVFKKERTEEETASVRRWVEQNKEALEYFRQASRVDKCQFVQSYHDSFLLRSPAHQRAPAIQSVLLKCEVQLRLLDGRAREALQDCLTSLRVGRHYGLQPTYFDHMMQWNFLELPLSSLPDILPRKELGETEYRESAKVFQSAMDSLSVAGALRADRVLEVDLLGRPSQLGKALPALGSLDMKAPWVPGWLKAETLALLDYYDKLLPLVEKPYYQAIAGVKEVDDCLEQSRMLFLGLFATSSETMARLPAELRTKLSEALIAVELEVNRRASGAYPGALGDVQLKYISQLPSDPFSGEAFRYAKQGEGYVLYSVGENGKDDGGKSAPREGPDDIAWTVTGEGGN